MHLMLPEMSCRHQPLVLLGWLCSCSEDPAPQRQLGDRARLFTRRVCAGLGAAGVGVGGGLPGGGVPATAAPVLHCGFRCSLDRTCHPCVPAGTGTAGSQSFAGARLPVTKASGLTAPYSLQEGNGEERNLVSRALASTRLPPAQGLPISCVSPPGVPVRALSLLP